MTQSLDKSNAFMKLDKAICLDRYLEGNTVYSPSEKEALRHLKKKLKETELSLDSLTEQRVSKKNSIIFNRFIKGRERLKKGDDLSFYI